VGRGGELGGERRVGWDRKGGRVGLGMGNRGRQGRDRQERKGRAGGEGGEERDYCRSKNTHLSPPMALSQQFSKPTQTFR
jgi:hypothetical protein